MSLWGPGKNHCSIKGHKKGINLNLVYNAMPFKLIHLACAPELPATPSIPHSPCQHSLSTGGVNVNSTTAWAERVLRDTEPEREKEDRKKIACGGRKKKIVFQFLSLFNQSKFHSHSVLHIYVYSLFTKMYPMIIYVKWVYRWMQRNYAQHCCNLALTDGDLAFRFCK